MKKLRYQVGFALLELSIALAVAAVSITAFAWSKQVEMREMRGKLHGELLAEANNALDQYMTTYFSTIVGAGSVPGVVNKMAPTVTELRTLNLLNNSFSATPLFGGTYKLTVTCSPSPCTADSKLSGRVWGSAPILNPLTSRVDGSALSSAQAVLGGEGGASQIGSGASIEWANGATTPNPEGLVEGILVARSGDGSAQLNQFLRRDGSLPMTGNLDMGGMELEGLRSVGLNSACTVTGRLASGPNGEVLSCRDSQYQTQGSAYWKDPVDMRADLALHACNASTSGQTRMVKKNDSGVVLSPPKPYVCNGGSWVPLAVDVNGDLNVPGVIRADGGFQVDGKEVVDANGYLVAANTAVENDPCPKNGILAKDANGLILSCQSGSWKKATGGGGLGEGQE